MMKTHQKYCAAEGGEFFWVYRVFFLLRKLGFLRGVWSKGILVKGGYGQIREIEGGMVDGGYGGYDRKIMH